MRIVKLKKITASALSFILALSFYGCGKKDVKVDDYGSNDAEDTGTFSDAQNESGEVQTLSQLFGERVKWDEAFAIQGKSAKVQLTMPVPDDDYMNVYKEKCISDGKDDEDRLVKSIFGDSAEKLEEISYKNETDYITLLYKYREIYHQIIGDIYDYFSSSEAYEKIMGSIDSGFAETYKWVDEDKYYIHMYEGKYNGIKYGLISAYDEASGRRFIFLDPISIKEYFPNKDYKTLLYESNFDTTKLAKKDIENECSMSVDEAKKIAHEFVQDITGFNEEDSNVDGKPQFYHSNAGLALYPYYLDDGSTTALTFSDSDYVSSIQNGGISNTANGVSRLAAQSDLAVEEMKEKNKDLYMYLTQYNSEGTVKPNIERNGYAFYLQSASMSMANSGDYYYMSTGNTGVVKVTDNGIYGVDLILVEETIDVIENVRLLDFEKIKECAKNALEDKLDMKKMGNPDDILIGGGALMYEPCKGENGDEYSCIPVWRFSISSYGGVAGPEGILGTAELSINAMDGSINTFQQYDEENGMFYTEDGTGYQSIDVSDESDEE